MDTMKKATEKNLAQDIGPVPVVAPAQTMEPEGYRIEDVDKPLSVNRRSEHQRKLARLLPGGWKQIQQIANDEKIGFEQAKAS